MEGLRTGPSASQVAVPEKTDIFIKSWLKLTQADLTKDPLMEVYCIFMGFTDEFFMKLKDANESGKIDSEEPFFPLSAFPQYRCVTFFSLPSVSPKFKGLSLSNERIAFRRGRVQGHHAAASKFQGFLP